MAGKTNDASTKRRKAQVISGTVSDVLESSQSLVAALAIAANLSDSNPDGLSADVTSELAEAAPTFGNVLRSIGAAVIDSQKALDLSVVETINSVADAKIEIATTVIQHLNDDGLPDPDATEIVTEEISLLQYATPTVHQWQYVALSMDLEAAQVDRKSGVTFKQAQGSVGVGVGGSGWGADLSLMFNSTAVESRTQSDWARSRLNFDAQLERRKTSKLADPVKLAKGPVIFIDTKRLKDETDSDGKVTRKLEINVTLINSTGTPLKNKNIDVDAGVLGNFTRQTATDGKIDQVIELLRGASQPEAQFPIIVSFGQMTRQITITL